MVREPDATMQPTPQDIQLMSKRRVLSFKPQLRLEWRGQDGQNETEQSDHSASLGDSITSSTRIRFSVHTGVSSGIFVHQEAIKVAAKRHKDARVVDVSFDSQAGQLAYKVKTYQDNNVWEGAVDAWTGQIIGEGTATPVSKLDEEDQLELAGLPKASIDLSAATALAEEKGSGKAISAGLEETNGRVVYKVIIVNKGATTKFVVDPKSGQIK